MRAISILWLLLYFYHSCGVSCPFKFKMHQWPSFKVSFLYLLPRHTQVLVFSAWFPCLSHIYFLCKVSHLYPQQEFLSFCTAWGRSCKFCSLDAKLLPPKSDKWQFATFYHLKAHALKQKEAVEKHCLWDHKECLCASGSLSEWQNSVS